MRGQVGVAAFRGGPCGDLVLALLEWASRAVLKLIGLPFDTHGEAALSEDEILGILAANAARGPRGEAKQELLRRVMSFTQRNARSAMVPRVGRCTPASILAKVDLPAPFSPSSA